jgi:hypothetical protein
MTGRAAMAAGCSNLFFGNRGRTIIALIMPMGISTAHAVQICKCRLRNGLIILRLFFVREAPYTELFLLDKELKVRVCDATETSFVYASWLINSSSSLSIFLTGEAKTQ